MPEPHSVPRFIIRQLERQVAATRERAAKLVSKADDLEATISHLKNGKDDDEPESESE